MPKYYLILMRFTLVFAFLSFVMIGMNHEQMQRQEALNRKQNHPELSDALLRILGNPELAISYDSNVVREHWKPLIAWDKKYQIYGDTCRERLSIHWPRDDVSLFRMEFPKEFPKKNAPKDIQCISGRDTLQGISVDLVVKFPNIKAVNDFYLKLKEKLGTPNPRCTDNQVTHWSIKPGLSIRWKQTNPESSYVDINIYKTDALDDTCTRI